MRRLTYYIGLTLDGFIAGPNEEVDFLPLSDDHTGSMVEDFPDVLPSHIRRALGVGDRPVKEFDTVIMGRGTYEPALREGITSPYSHLRQYVVSRSLEKSPDEQVTLVRTDPVAAVRELKAEDSPFGIYLAGGGQLAGALLPEIDRLVVKKYPVVAGSGIPSFATAFRPTRFALTHCRTFENGCAVLEYDRAHG
ncbi:dihydrofolate reductase family protein [Streptomyces sp. 549]|uniref:dihydrofolate reductase family protein n=1 Tax=Streptomyces sp. 549 TaxID=3049076 RepID=UPI0024C444B9|nr:dihydrofolate reductase family protein [Streptomyces sp. 549]MDK1473001.1 dihydrofolate reductase family protein [Streptomyces sp. 549]